MSCLRRACKTRFVHFMRQEYVNLDQATRFAASGCGTALTFGGRSLAESFGLPFYLLFYGLILAGAVVFLKGVLELLLGRKL